MPIRLTITPDDFKRAKIVKPGWYPTLVKEIVQEPNAKRDGENIVVDFECADNKSEFMGVPAKVWFTEKYPTGYVNFVKAFAPNLNESVAFDFEFEETKGRYVYGKWTTNRGKDGTDPPRNHIEDFAPIASVKAWAHLANVGTTQSMEGVAGFDRGKDEPPVTETAAAGGARKK
jgi:hypothetical protein